MLITTSLRIAGVSSDQITIVLTGIPHDPRVIVSAFNLDPHTHSFVCCPQCFALSVDHHPDTQAFCDALLGSGEPCSAKLKKKHTSGGKESFIPIRKYLHQDMKQWMARLLARKGIEDIMDATPVVKTASGHATDIWDASVFQNFLGPDKKPFINPSLQEGRFLFGLNVDSFNPYYNREAKKSFSSTAIYLVCYNLPPDMRYQPENMYLVGIIPGPGKPSKSQINHFIRLLVNELLPFWDPGVFFSRTAKYTAGRHVRCALIPLVCDALGARSVAGFRSHSSKYFCTFCYLDLSNIENLDSTTWPLRDPNSHRQNAEAWRNAPSLKAQLEIEELFGVYWSELLRLPYWNAILFTVVDAMHNLYLGLLKGHCRDIWGMDIQVNEDDGSSHTKKKSVEITHEQMKQGLQALDQGNLQTLTRPVLWQICELFNLRRAGRKSQLKDELLKWRSSGANQTWLSQYIQTHFPTFVESESALLNNSKIAKQLDNGERLLQGTPTSEALHKLNKTTLQMLCARRKCIISGTKQDLTNELLKWVRLSLCSTYNAHHTQFRSKHIMLQIFTCFKPNLHK